MSSRLFWKLLIAFGGLVCIAFAGGAWVVAAEATNGWLVAVAGVVLVSLLLVTSWIVWIVLRPLRSVTRAALRMAQGKYDEPVYLGVRDELGDLAMTFNSMRHEMVARVAERQRLSTVLSAMSDGVIAMDQSMRVQFANKAAGRMLKFSPSSALGRSLLKIVRSHRLHAFIQSTLDDGGHHEIEFQWGEDDRNCLLVSATPFKNDESTAVILMIYNLSEIRQLEAMRRDFVANVSHELKTPLSSIKAYAETLSAGAINDEQNRERFVHQIEEQAERLHLLISDLLSLARIEQGSQLLKLKTVHLEGIVRSCVEEQQRAASVKNIELHLAPIENPHATVVADETGLRQILANLIDNAIKYTPDGGKVSVGWEVVTPKMVSLYVKDTGIGIPADMLDHVFERFYRVDKARSRELGGTGLGLAIVKHLAQSLGGRVEVDSEPGKGSCFSVQLPSPGE